MNQQLKGVKVEMANFS